jgi:hypothetical protein
VSERHLTLDLEVRRKLVAARVSEPPFVGVGESGA